MLKHEAFILEALREAEKDENEVPVGAVVVYEGRVIARAHNERESGRPFAHAEMLAMERACQTLGTRRLHGCALYVTLEPCPMCAGALNWAQVPRIVYGAPDPKRGSTLFSPSLFHPKTTLSGGILQEDCATLMKEFFKEKR